MAEAPSPPSTAFVFVIHGGALEAKSALLACSLRQKVTRNNRIVAAVMEPRGVWGDLQPETKALLETLNIEIAPTTNLIDVNYPHGNKIGSMGQVSGPAAFLDSDMMMLRPFVHHYAMVNADAAVKPADIDTFTRGGGGWTSVYHRFGLEKPERSLTATATGEKMHPYFNAGFVWVKDGATFSEAWADTARQIDADPKIRNKRPWLDQIALPLALRRLDWRLNIAGAELNYPAHIQPISDPLPYIAHYHWPRIIQREPYLMGDLRFYLGKYPNLSTIMLRDPSWSDLVVEAQGE